MWPPSPPLNKVVYSLFVVVSISAGVSPGAEIVTILFSKIIISHVQNHSNLNSNPLISKSVSQNVCRNVCRNVCLLASSPEWLTSILWCVRFIPGCFPIEYWKTKWNKAVLVIVLIPRGEVRPERTCDSLDCRRVRENWGIVARHSNAALLTVWGLYESEGLSAVFCLKNCVFQRQVWMFTFNKVF